MVHKRPRWLRTDSQRKPRASVVVIVSMAIVAGVLLGLLLRSNVVSAGSLKDIEHVVIFMQENRSWNNVCIYLSVRIGQY